jgi:hypothetical protein
MSSLGELLLMSDPKLFMAVLHEQDPEKHRIRIDAQNSKPGHRAHAAVNNGLAAAGERLYAALGGDD